ncbi:MAG TPA: rhombosortase [Steroidobacteraceae bacterium]|jgi:rhomboid family GlyGly-CTERM serine protease|nr:rhombosortase [Steroidobacteraceae bacterium]
MPRETANRTAPILAALQWDRGRWIWLLLILLLLGAVLGLGDSMSALLRYDRSAIAAGGWWRLLTAHIVHLDLHHLILNELGLILMWSLFAQDYDPVEWCAIVLGGALAISSGLWWLSPHVAWYVGASGVLHSVMAAGAANHLVMRVWDRWILLIGLCAKLGWEQWGGHPQQWVVVDAHLYGAACGFALGAALSWRTAIIRHRSGARG